MTPRRHRSTRLLGVLLAGTALAAGCSSGGGSARPGAPNRPQTAASTRPGKGPTTTAEPAVTAINTEETAPLLEPGDTSNKVGGPSIACRVSLTGDLQAEFNGYDDQTAFSSDYYLSDAELNAARSTPRSTVAGIAAPTLPPGAAPVAGWFILTCQGGDVTLSLTSDPRATVDEVPFGPGTYRVGTGAGKPDEFTVVASFFRDPSQLWVPETGAQIVIDRFDTSGASGSFDVPMRRQNPDGSAGTGSIRFSGSFSVTCHSGARCQRS